MILYVAVFVILVLALVMAVLIDRRWQSVLVAVIGGLIVATTAGLAAAIVLRSVAPDAIERAVHPG
jgi:uncharacterized membrane protein